MALTDFIYLDNPSSNPQQCACRNIPSPGLPFFPPPSGSRPTAAWQDELQGVPDLRLAVPVTRTPAATVSLAARTPQAAPGGLPSLLPFSPALLPERFFALNLHVARFYLHSEQNQPPSSAASAYGPQAAGRWCPEPWDPRHRPPAGWLLTPVLRLVEAGSTPAGSSRWATGATCFVTRPEVSFSDTVALGFVLLNPLAPDSFNRR